jgi:hypothetical protein
MFVGNNDIVKSFGQYRMKLTPHIKLDRHNEVITKESYGTIAMYDISQKFDLLWSTTLGIKEAHAAITLFEGIGYYPAPMETQ